MQIIIMIVLFIAIIIFVYLIWLYLDTLKYNLRRKGNEITYTFSQKEICVICDILYGQKDNDIYSMESRRIMKKLYNFFIKYDSDDYVVRL